MVLHLTTGPSECSPNQTRPSCCSQRSEDMETSTLAFNKTSQIRVFGPPRRKHSIPQTTRKDQSTLFTSSGRQHHPGLQGALSWVDFELNPDGFEAKEQLKHVPRTCMCTFSSLPCLPLFQETTKPAQALGSGTDSAPCTASATSLACPQGWGGLAAKTCGHLELGTASEQLLDCPQKWRKSQDSPAPTGGYQAPKHVFKPVSSSV